jgi:hypothetical protein
MIVLFFESEALALQLTPQQLAKAMVADFLRRNSEIVMGGQGEFPLGAIAFYRGWSIV